MEISTRYIEALLHSASGHQWSRKAHQAGGQNMQQVDELMMSIYLMHQWKRYNSSICAGPGFLNVSRMLNVFLNKGHFTSRLY